MSRDRPMSGDRLMSRDRLPRRLTWPLACLAGLTVAVLVGRWYGAVAGAVALPVAQRALARLESPAARRERQRAAADLPYVVDLLAAGLRAGLPVGRAVQVVGAAVSGPLAGRLGRVERALGLGLPPAHAWAALSELAGGDRLAGAVVRSADSGAALAAAFERLADDLRAGRMAAADAAARRAGVLIVLPLGLCFLPAFVFAGVVPVIVAVLGDVLR
jgi:pilus assembly protein TadC